uniref:Uncharacterized protein n=1 Tax=Anguilla anguilla TaxID=7936 RepID=A0A0E9Q608_ANGAN
MGHGLHIKYIRKYSHNINHLLHEMNCNDPQQSFMCIAVYYTS